MITDEHRDKLRKNIEIARSHLPVLAMPSNFIQDKKCGTCNKIKHRSNFGFRNNGKWFRGTCKECEAKGFREYSKNNPEKIIYHNRRLSLKRSGATIEIYEKLYAQQEGKCYICEVFDNTKRLHVDHCHKTGIVRSLLCGNCNTAIGLFMEDIKVMKKAIEYLSKERS